MPVINWILNQQVQLGMILCAGLFVPWGQRRSCFVPRLAAGVWGFLALTDTLAFLPLWAKLLLYTTLLFGLIWFSFDCSPLHALFYTTCAYAVQRIASKLAYMPIIWLIQHGRTDRLVTFVILLFSNLVVCLVIYLLFTLRIRRGRLLFDNVKTVLYSGFFLIAAVYLSVVLEDVLDSSAESYLTAYLALNAFCILFAITILALEFSNCSIKSLEQENDSLAHLTAARSSPLTAPCLMQATKSTSKPLISSVSRKKKRAACCSTTATMPCRFPSLSAMSRSLAAAASTRCSAAPQAVPPRTRITRKPPLTPCRMPAST